MGKYDISDEDLAKWRAQLEQEAQAALPSEEIVIAGQMRRGGAGASMAASKAGGGLAYAAVKLFNKKKAGGLPQNVILAVTPDKLHAFKCKFKGGKNVADGEVAVWDRAGLRFSTEKKMGMTALTIESPAEGEKVTLVGASVKDDPLTLELIRTLAGPDAA